MKLGMDPSFAARWGRREGWESGEGCGSCNGERE